ncbi:MAG: class I SAM-dependent methyltransferase [Lentisphaerae bacterium]|nr:class I SAM-dependent methyltransferase [Lentisphaerota bacterium]
MNNIKHAVVKILDPLLNMTLGRAYRRLFPGKAGLTAAIREDYWGYKHTIDTTYWSGTHWGNIPQIQQYMNEMISGDRNKDYIAYALNKYVAPLRAKYGTIRLLSICCGAGHLEHALLNLGFADMIDAYDASQASVTKARELMRSNGWGSKINFFVQDVNKLQLQPDVKYHVVFNESGLHHLSGLEHLFETVEKSMFDDSVCICHDYIGPNHLQWTERQLDVVNDIIQMLPPGSRQSISDAGKIYANKSVFKLDELLKLDPSEAVRSADILRVMERFFDIVEKKDHGGTILHILLDDIAGNFTLSPYRNLLPLLIGFEKRLISIGYLPSDFAFWVAKKKTHPKSTA